MGVLYFVKHAQASLDAPSGDLSPLGWQQGRRLGASMSASRVAPAIVATGTLDRHRQTVAAMTDDQPVDVLEDEGWNDLDHASVLARHEPVFGDAEPTRAEFQEWTEQAWLRWASGAHDHEYAETFGDFARRVARAKLGLVSRLAPDATAVVVTCGGPIAWVSAALWAGWGPEQDARPWAAAWSRMNSVVVNTSVTKVALAPRGLSLVSFNDHSHLERVERTFR